MYAWLENLVALITKNPNEHLFLAKTPEVHERLEELVKKTDSETQVGVVRKGLTLLDVAVRAHESGGRIAVVEGTSGKFHTLSGFVMGDGEPLKGMTPGDPKRDWPVIVKAESTGGYAAKCPMFPTALAYGNTRAEALENITKDIENHLRDGIQPIQVDFVTTTHTSKPKASA